MKDNELAQLLRARAYQPPRHGFEKHILAAARVTQQRMPPLQWLQQMFGAQQMPQWRVAYALVFTLGIALGFAVMPHPFGPQGAAPTYLSDGAVL